MTTSSSKQITVIRPDQTQNEKPIESVARKLISENVLKKFTVEEANHLIELQLFQTRIRAMLSN